MKRLMAYGLVALVPVAGLVAFLAVRGAEGNTTATATLRDANGKNSGIVRLATAGNSAQVVAQVTLPASAAGFHGFHIHAKGVCDPTAVDPASGQVVPFFTAGGHLGGGAGGQVHSGHDGDMPSLLVNKDGMATATFRTDRATLARSSTPTARRSSSMRARTTSATSPLATVPLGPTRQRSTRVTPAGARCAGS